MAGRHPTLPGSISMSKVYSLRPTARARASDLGGDVGRSSWTVVDEGPGARARPDIWEDDSD